MITITEKFSGVFKYNGIWNLAKIKLLRCQRCKLYLSSLYVIIIEKLRENGLLPDDYGMFCCKCYRHRKSLKNGTLFSINF